MSYDLNRSYLTIPGGLSNAADANEGQQGESGKNAGAAAPADANNATGSGNVEGDDFIEEETEKGHS